MEAMRLAASSAMPIGTNVLLSKLMCNPVMEEKASRSILRRWSWSESAQRLMRVSSVY
jgi:hypothetical protein